jgi:hypothetical protein
MQMHMLSARRSTVWTEEVAEGIKKFGHEIKALKDSVVVILAKDSRTNASEQSAFSFCLSNARVSWSKAVACKSMC